MQLQCEPTQYTFSMHNALYYVAVVPTIVRVSSCSAILYCAYTYTFYFVKKDLLAVFLSRVAGRKSFSYYVHTIF